MAELKPIQSLDLKRYETIETHIKTKAENQSWLYDCLHETPQSFPYAPSSARVLMTSYIPPTQPTLVPQPENNRAPVYVLNIPLGTSWGKKDWEEVKSLVTLIQKEAFETNAQNSQETVKKRLSLVIGANRAKSFLKNRNKDFKKLIQNIPQIEGISLRVFGFFWKIDKWKTSQNVLPFTKAQKLLRVLSLKSYINLTYHLEGKESLSELYKKVIPFNKIRERIKSGFLMRGLVSSIQRRGSFPIYFGTFDGDAKGLKSLFTHFDKAIQRHNSPSALTLGYRVSEAGQKFIEFGVDLDMKVRAAMNAIIPFSAYLPEPSSLFRLRKQGETLDCSKRLTNHSFEGEGSGLENRRFIQNGKEKGLLDTCLFLANGKGVQTTIPERMKTKKNQSFPSLTRAFLKTEKCLRSLRAISQTHIHPKQWADNVYSALDFSLKKVTDATQPMMHIFGVFDPLTRMFKEDRFSISVFHRVLTNYNAPLDAGAKNTLDTARTQLLKLKMKKKMIDSIEKAARASGLAICQTLLNF